MIIEDLKDIENQNDYHIRILVFLMWNLKNKIKKLNIIVDHYKKGHYDKYREALNDLKETKPVYVLDDEKGIRLNPEREELKPFFKAVEIKPTLLEHLKNKERNYLDVLTKKENQMGIENLYKATKETEKH